MFNFRCHARLYAALIAASLSEGAVVFSNFAGQPGYTPNSLYEVKVAEPPSAPGFPPLLVKEYRGMGFVAPEDAVVERIYLPLMFRSGSIRISLTSAAVDGFPGTVLDSVVLTSAPDSEFEFRADESGVNSPAIQSGR
jgi:hypothetical protein